MPLFPCLFCFPFGFCPLKPLNVSDMFHVLSHMHWFPHFPIFGMIRKLVVACCGCCKLLWWVCMIVLYIRKLFLLALIWDMAWRSAKAGVLINSYTLERSISWILLTTTSNQDMNTKEFNRHPTILVRQCRMWCLIWCRRSWRARNRS